MNSRDQFRTILENFAGKAKATLPDSGGRIDSAVKLVLSGDVELHDDGSATVGSRSNPVKTYAGVNGTCPCVDHPRAPDGWCSHRIARALQLRVDRAMRDAQTTMEEIPASEPHTDAENGMKEQNTPMETSPDVEANFTPPDALKPYVVTIRQKPYVLYSGLLALATGRGLVSLKAHFTSVTPELALAEAEAVFADGRTFGESADSTPANVGASIRHAFPRMALTRAKARCLRDALNLGALCSVEELSGE
jgi:hypothetical protein